MATKRQLEEEVEELREELAYYENLEESMLEILGVDEEDDGDSSGDIDD